MISKIAKYKIAMAKQSERTDISKMNKKALMEFSVPIEYSKTLNTAKKIDA